MAPTLPRTRRRPPARLSGPGAPWQDDAVDAASPEPAPVVAAVVFPERLAPGLAEDLGRRAHDAGLSLDVRLVGWADDPAVRRAKARGDRSQAWTRAHEPPLRDDQRAALADADVALASEIPIDLVALAPQLRFVQATAAGVEPLIGALKGSGVRLASAAGLSGAKVAEFVMARLLQVWADLRTIEALQRGRRWAPDEVTTEAIGGRSVLVVGTGGIGEAVARRAQAFDLRCIGVRRRPELGAPAGFARVVGPGDLGAVLPEADAVVIAAPATARTAVLVGPVQLAAMRRGAVLVNVARGSLVDEDAVVAALHSGHLGAAVLDVMRNEPLSRRSALWRAPNAYLSPHIANDWRPEYLDAVAERFVENVARDARGEPLRNEVDLDEGY